MKKNRCCFAAVIALLFSLYLAACMPTGPDEEGSSGSSAYWSHRLANNEILEVSYCQDNSCPQYAALHINSGYFRLIYGKTSGWGPSSIITPSFWEIEHEPYAWEEVSSPGEVTDMVYFNGVLLALVGDNNYVIYRSVDSGESWETIASLNCLLSLDVDSIENKLYASGCDGIYQLTGNGDNYEQLLSWHWDPTVDVDFENGIGWAAIRSWGSLSGILRKMPGEGWKNYYKDSGQRVIADKLNPEFGYGQSVNFGNRLCGNDGYVDIPEEVIYSTVIDNIPYSIGRTSYSIDRWQTITDFPMTIQTAVEYQERIFMAPAAEVGVIETDFNDYQSIGLEQNISILTVGGGNLYAVASSGEIYRSDVSGQRDVSTYHQGAPLVYEVREEAENIVIRVEGMVSALDFNGEITIHPPAQDMIRADVAMQADADEIHLDIANHLEEAFKPVMISSMKISDTVWDSQAAFFQVGDKITDIPLPISGFVIDPESQADRIGNRFGLKGGTSEWKTNSPTVEIVLKRDFLLNGWVTPSQDPNDDNVAMWAAVNTIPPAWQYEIVAKK